MRGTWYSLGERMLVELVLLHRRMKIFAAGPTAASTYAVFVFGFQLHVRLLVLTPLTHSLTHSHGNTCADAGILASLTVVQRASEPMSFGQAKYHVMRQIWRSPFSTFAAFVNLFIHKDYLSARLGFCFRLDFRNRPCKAILSYWFWIDRSHGSTNTLWVSIEFDVVIARG